VEKTIKSQYTMGVLTELNNKANYHRNKFVNCKQLVDDDFAYQLAWQLEDMVTNHYLMNLYLSVAHAVEESDAQTGLLYCLSKYKEYTSKTYNVRGTSTSEVSNMMSTWKYICTLEVCEVLEKMIKQKPKLNLAK
jgi:hypothetical protein